MIFRSVNSPPVADRLDSCGLIAMQVLLEQSGAATEEDIIQSSVVILKEQMRLE